MTLATGIRDLYPWKFVWFCFLFADVWKVTSCQEIPGYILQNPKLEFKNPQKKKKKNRWLMRGSECLAKATRLIKRLKINTNRRPFFVLYLSKNGKLIGQFIPNTQEGKKRHLQNVWCIFNGSHFFGFKANNFRKVSRIFPLFFLSKFDLPTCAIWWTDIFGRHKVLWVW